MIRIVDSLMIVLVTVLAAGADDVVVSRAEVRLAPLAIQAGGRLPVAVRFSMAPGWHTYAENPGDSGMPPEITLTGPDGFVLEKWQFPPAKSFTDAAGTTFGYENAVVLIGALQLPASLPAERTFELEFNVAWMVCKDVCVPLSDTLKVPLKAQPEAPAEARLEWERFLEAGGWSACVETRKEGEKPAK